MIRTSLKPFLIAAFTTSVATCAAVAAQQMTPVGTLTCTLSPPDTVAELTATSELSCHFGNSTSGRDANFTGRVKRLGVERERQAKFVLVWSVHTDEPDFNYQDLEGEYAGSLEQQSALDTSQAGLLGGSGKSVWLKPVTRDPALPEGWAISLMTLELKPLKA